jgi:sulfite reductase (ferredoxin)
VDRFTTRYVAERTQNETFGAFIKRIGKAECKKMVEDMMTVPTHDVAPEFYVDWGDAREYGVGDLGEGECAGEVVTPAEFQLTAAEREAFEAQLQLERGEVEAAAATAYGAMSHGALALLKHRGVGFPEDAESVLHRFKKHVYDTNLFHDDFVGGKFAQYYFEAHENRANQFNAEQAHRLVEETQVFLEACYACYARLLQQPAPAAV